MLARVATLIELSHGADLVAVVAYRKGAAELLRRLNAAGELHATP